MTDTLYSLWACSSLMNAREEIKEMNEQYSCDMPLPTSPTEAVVCYQDQRMMNFVSYKVASETLRLTASKKNLEKLREEQKRDRKAVAYYNRTISGCEASIANLEKISEFIKANNNLFPIQTMTLQEILKADRVLEAIEFLKNYKGEVK